jgi:HEAT repeat protein
MVEFRAKWATLGADEREQLIRSLVEYAEDHVEVNYHRVFREALEDANPRVRRLAVSGLWEDDDSSLQEAFLDLLQSDPDVDVRAEAARALQRYAEDQSVGGEESGGDRLVDLLVVIGEDPSEYALVRRRCIETAGPLAADPRAYKMIREAYADDDQTLAAGALRAMGLSRQARWIPEIERAMESPDAELRFEAAGAAGMLGETRLIESLVTLLDDEDSEVQAAAVGALGAIGGPGAIRVLRRLTESGVIEDETMIQDALDEALLSEDPLASN